MGLKLDTFQHLHENIQEEIHSTHVSFLMLEKLVIYIYIHTHTYMFWPILYLIRNFDHNFSSSRELDGFWSERRLAFTVSFWVRMPPLDCTYG